jgi:hypothetical protein
VGEHTRSVLGELVGYSADRIEALLSAGIIGAAPPDRAVPQAKR